VLTEYIEANTETITELILNNGKFRTLVEDFFPYQQYLHQKYVDAYSNNADRIYDEMKEEE